MEAVKSLEDVWKEINLEASAGDVSTDQPKGQPLRPSQLPWGAWLFEQAVVSSSLSTSSKRKMLVVKCL